MTGALEKLRLRDKLASDIRLRLLGGILGSNDLRQFEKDLRALMKSFDSKVHDDRQGPRGETRKL